MVIDVLDKNGSKVAEHELKGDIYEGRVNEPLFYEVVKMQLANRRSGTASTKTRAEVRGGGAKPWRQKGSGRARAGTATSPVWRHGGTVFGPKPRDYSYRMPKKAVRGALKSALRLKVKENRLKVFDSLELDEPRTKAAIKVLEKSGLTSALIVVDGPNPNLTLGVRNLRGFKVLDAGAINVYDILRHDDLVITKSALEKVEGIFQ
ncbi:MAG: 50S ribosomal protein L4 [Thermodesulfobacteriota bacterium]